MDSSGSVDSKNVNALGFQSELTELEAFENMHFSNGHFWSLFGRPCKVCGKLGINTLIIDNLASLYQVLSDSVQN